MRPLIALTPDKLPYPNLRFPRAVEHPRCCPSRIRVFAGGLVVGHLLSRDTYLEAALAAHGFCIPFLHDTQDRR